MVVITNLSLVVSIILVFQYNSVAWLLIKELQCLKTKVDTIPQQESPINFC